MNNQDEILLGSIGGIVGFFVLYKLFSFNDEKMTKSEIESIEDRPRFDDDGKYIDYSGQGITKRKRKTHKKSHKIRK
jgi:hypothetical protein